MHQYRTIPAAWPSQYYRQPGAITEEDAKVRYSFFASFLLMYPDATLDEKMDAYDFSLFYLTTDGEHFDRVRTDVRNWLGVGNPYRATGLHQFTLGYCRTISEDKRIFRMSKVFSIALWRIGCSVAYIIPVAIVLALVYHWTCAQ